MPLTMTACPAARPSSISNRCGTAPALLLAAALALVSGPVRAELLPAPDLSHPLSLQDVVRLAVERNLQVAQAHESWESARGSRTSAWSGVLPNLSGNVGYSRDTQKFSGVNPETGRPIASGQTADYYSLGLSGGLNLLDLPSLYSFRGSTQALTAAGYGYDDALQGIVLQVKQQYYALTQSEELARVTQESYTLRQEQHRRAESLFQLGSVARSDVLQAQVNLSAAERDKISAENRIEQERARLAMILALPVDSRLEVEAPPAVDETQAAPSEAALFALAEKQRPDLRQAAATLAASRSGEQAARYRRWPSLGGGYSYSKQHDYSVGMLFRNPDQDARWGVSVGLSVPLFDGLATKGLIQRSAADRRARQEAYEEQRLRVALDVREALLGLKNASEGIRSAREGVNLAEESARLQKALYESGGGTLLEWNNAQVELTRAKVAVVEAEAGYHQAEAALERAVGGLTR